MTKDEAIAKAASMLASGSYGKTSAKPVNPGVPGTPWKVVYTTAGPQVREGEIR